MPWWPPRCWCSSPTWSGPACGGGCWRWPGRGRSRRRGWRWGGPAPPAVPVYVLVGMRRAPRSAEAALTFFVISVVSTAVTLLGAGLLYALTGAVHLDRLAAALGGRPELRGLPLTSAAVVLVL